MFQFSISLSFVKEWLLSWQSSKYCFYSYIFFKKVTVSDILECFWTLFWSCSQEALFHCKIFGTNISLFLKSQSIPSTHYVQTSDFPWYLETSRKIKLKKSCRFSQRIRKQFVHLWYDCSLFLKISKRKSYSEAIAEVYFFKIYFLTLFAYLFLWR